MKRDQHNRSPTYRATGQFRPLLSPIPLAGCSLRNKSVAFSRSLSEILNFKNLPELKGWLASLRSPRRSQKHHPRVDSPANAVERKCNEDRVKMCCKFALTCRQLQAKHSPIMHIYFWTGYGFVLTYVDILCKMAA